MCLGLSWFGLYCRSSFGCVRVALLCVVCVALACFVRFVLVMCCVVLLWFVACSCLFVFLGGEGRALVR